MKDYIHMEQSGPRRTIKLWQLLLVILIPVALVGTLVAIEQVSDSNKQTSSTKINTVQLDETSQAILTLSNEYRKEKGLNVLLVNQKLTDAAQMKANDMCKRDYFAHDLPDGKKWYTLIENEGYEYKSAGENLAKGYREASGALGGWKASPLHNANLLGEWKDIGVGYSLCDGKRYMVQEFGESI